MALYRCYVEGDCDLAEINPLILTTDGRVHALDAKVTLDDNAAFRHPEWEEFAGTETLDERELLAKEKGLNYIGLSGSVGIIANGAGLAMSTLDVVTQAGGSAANFLDIGGGANADVMAAALEVINTDPAVRSIFVNIFGGITRVRRGGQRHRRGPGAGRPALAHRAAPRRHQRRGGARDPRLASVGSPGRGRDHARRRPPCRGAGRRRQVSIFVDENTKVIVQGLTGSQGRFHGLRNRDYGTQVVAGVTPGQGRHRRGRRPRLRHRRPTPCAATGADASFVVVPPKGAPAAILEAAEAGVRFIVCITEGIPAQDEALLLQRAAARPPRRAPARPQLPGGHLPGQVQHRHHLGRHRPARWSRGDREPLGDPHLPGAARAVPAEGGPDHVRRASAATPSRARASSTAWPPSRPTPTPAPS